ncbi:MAG: aldehyde dehydrogenase family protein [Phycisphaerales bacterium]|nr:aldehyde dehydrogenase family protein [Phycisphaerales bacterium]NNM24615.1 aldehyde dehydrogenase family protein [Phycisphaerales bacterium]
MATATTTKENATGLRASYPYYLAGEAVAANTDLEVTNKYTGDVATRVALADAATIDTAITAAVEAFDELRRWPAFRRKAVLQHVVRRMEERAEEMAVALAIEAGKPLRDARGEVTRGIDTFTIAMEESTRLYGEVQPLDISPRAEGYQAIWKRVPIGPCSFISPFNFPINLAAHKIAPAIAVGCSFVLKPASRTPIGALIMGEILAETDLPRGAFSILPCRRDGADLFTTDDRFKLLSFTGSPDVGWDLKTRAGKKKVVLELGGNAACVVDEDADLDFATDRIIHGAFYQSGQSCIGVQRIIVHRDVYPEVREMLRTKVSRLKKGDPLDEQTFLGPLITEGDAQRMEAWVNEAVEGGASVLVGGRRDGVFYDATIVENAPKDASITCEEAFGPIATLQPFDDFEEAMRIVDDSAFGLQAGVFTRDINRAFFAFEELEVGGVVINDVPSMRVDSMPYGGVKDSGLGREGIRFAMEDMTEIRLMVLNRIGRASM